MMAFPGMLVHAAKLAEMKVPPHADDADSWSHDDFPYFSIFCMVQLCRPMQPGEHFENARIVASIEESRLKTITFNDLLALGLRFQQ